MPNFQVVSRERHASRRWGRYADYAFASKERTAPLVMAELPKAVMSLPVGFVEQGEGFVPVAILGLAQEKNLFVAVNGQWLGAYAPAAFRSYPFRLARAQDGQQVLCVDENSALVTDGPEGEAFFGEDGEPSKAVRDVLDFLSQIEQGRVATERACALLKQHGLIRPWPIAVQTDTGTQQIAGLFHIDEAALNALPGAQLAELCQGGALLVAYCQLLSMQHLSQLDQLTQAHAKAAAQAQAMSEKAPARDLDLGFLNDGGTISFGNLG